MADMRWRPDRFRLRHMTLLRARRGALAPWLLVLLGLLGLTACATADLSDDLETRLQFEGYQNLSVSMTTDRPGDVVTVRARGNIALSDEEAIENLQNIIWNSLPRRFDSLDIQVGMVHSVADYQQLSQRFGPRDRVLDEQRMGTDASKVLIWVFLGVGLLVLLVAAVAVAVYRRRRWEEREQAERLALMAAPERLALMPAPTPTPVSPAPTSSSTYSPPAFN